MRLWYLLLALICQFLFCCKAQDKGSTTVQQEASLLKFFKLNGDNYVARNTAINFTNKNETFNHSRNCNLFIKGMCVHKLKSKSNNVKKSFRPNDYDDDDYDDDDDEAPDDEEFSEETRDHEKLYDEEPEDIENYVPRHGRPGFEDGIDNDMDADWDWESQRRYYGRHDRERWRLRHPPDYDDDYEPIYSPYYYHYPRHTRHHHHRRRHHYQAPAHANYRTFSHTVPSWYTYPQGYPGGTPISTPPLSSYVSNSAGAGWIQAPASSNAGWQPRFYLNQGPATNMFKSQLAGTSSWGTYQQNVYNYPHRESNSFFIPPYSASSNPHLQVTTQNSVQFSPANFLHGIATSVTPLSSHIYQYPRVIYSSRHFAGPFSRSFPKHREFSDAVLNRIRDQNLH